VNQRASWDNDFFRKPAVALHAEEYAINANGFLSTPTKFASTTKNIRLHRHPIAGAPFSNILSQRRNLSSDLAARYARQLDWDWQASFLQPKIKMIQAASPHRDDYFIRSGLRLRQVMNFKSTGRAVGDQLKRFHRDDSIACVRTGQGTIRPSEADSPFGRRRSYCGFTLIELLVVIG